MRSRGLVALVSAVGIAVTLFAAAPAPAADVLGRPQPSPTAELAATGINAAKAPCGKIPSLKGRKAGQLLAYKEVKVDPSLLKGARMWRVLYTTADVDEGTLDPVCGLIIAPAKKKDQRAQIVAWAHGTIGIHQSCQPSNDPSKLLSATPSGIGAVSYGSGSSAVNGKPTKGSLQSIINSGRMVTATDYYSGAGQPPSEQQHYLTALPSGAAVLDSARAGIQLLKKVNKGKQPKSWKLLTWGHSQGGYSALWAGQLAKQYFQVAKLKNDPKINLVGVAAIAPASSFVATDQSPPELIGRHLADLEMHMPAAVIDGNPVGVMGPAIFSYVTTSYDKYTEPLSAGARMPGYPVSDPNPQLADILTGPANGEGISVSEQVSVLCSNNVADAAKIGLLTNIYNYPSVYAYFVPPLWGQQVNGVWQGGLDKACTDPATAAGVRTWCTWMAYNQPGPQGINPYSKLPLRSNGQPANVLIAQGMNDTIVYCQSPGTGMPSPVNCVSRQLYDALGSACSQTNVQLHAFAQTPTSPATHLSIPGQIDNNGKAAFKGSPLDKFMNGSFKGSLGKGCSAKVVN